MVIKNGFNAIKMPNEIEDFGGGVIMSVGIIRENFNVDGCEENDTRFRIVKDDAQCYDVIVGRNFTDLHKFAYYRYDDQFNFVVRKDFPFQQFPQIDSKDSRQEFPQISETIKLSRASISFVQLKLEEDETYLPFQNNSDSTVVVPRGMILHTAITLKENLPEIQNVRKQILNLLNRFRNCVALDLYELGCTNLIQMDTQMKPGSDPCYSKPYPTKVAKRELINYNQKPKRHISQ